VKNLFGVE